MSAWHFVNDEDGHRVRRILVPGGWLYQVEFRTIVEPQRIGEADVNHTGWHPPVFIPAPNGGES